MSRGDKYRRDLRPGEILFREGDAGDCAFLVEVGALDVFRERAEGEEIVGSVGPGELLGEMALLDGGVRSACVRARDATAVRVITRHHLQERLESTDPLLRMLLHIVLERYRAAMQDSAAADFVPESRSLQKDRDEALTRLRMVQALEGALDRDEFVLHYQPIVRTETQTTAGFEALIRWQRPGEGLVGPNQFIPAAEGSELIEDIGRWVMRTACHALRRMTDATTPAQPLYMAVNVAGRHLAAPTFYDEVMAAIEASGIAPNQLILDITETQLIQHWESAAELLSRLRAVGVQIAVDDFGIGYSSLSYLFRFPVDALKVDRAFVVAMDSARGRNILKGIAALAHALGLRVIVEGVEKLTQARFLYDYGFEFIQGFLYSKGLPEAEATAAITRQWQGPGRSRASAA